MGLWTNYSIRPIHCWLYWYYDVYTDDWWASALPQLEPHSYPQHVRSGNRSGPKIESAER